MSLNWKFFMCSLHYSQTKIFFFIFLVCYHFLLYSAKFWSFMAESNYEERQINYTCSLILQTIYKSNVITFFFQIQLKRKKFKASLKTGCFKRVRFCCGEDDISRQYDVFFRPIFSTVDLKSKINCVEVTSQFLTLRPNRSVHK